MIAKKCLTKKERLIAAELLMWFPYDIRKFLKEVTAEFYATQKIYRGETIDYYARELPDLLLNGRAHVLKNDRRNRKQQIEEHFNGMLKDMFSQKIDKKQIGLPKLNETNHNGRKKNL